MKKRAVEIVNKKAKYEYHFLQRFEAASPTTLESLMLGYNIESQLGDQASAERYRLELLERFPGAIKAIGSASEGQH